MLAIALSLSVDTVLLAVVSALNNDCALTMSFNPFISSLNNFSSSSLFSSLVSAVF